MGQIEYNQHAGYNYKYRISPAACKLVKGFDKPEESSGPVFLLLQEYDFPN